MQEKNWKADGLLLLAAIIWGLAFVAQKEAMNDIGPFTFNGVRFALGAISLIPVIMLFPGSTRHPQPEGKSKLWWMSLVAGTLLFLGSNLQQIGLVETTAGNAGFITGLYVVLVPMIGLFWGQKSNPSHWLGAILSAVGLYFLAVTQSFTIQWGDSLVLTSAIFWAFHVLLLSSFARQVAPLLLAISQFALCAFLSMAVAIFWEPITLEAIGRAWIPIAYAGFLSVGVAYTLQVVAQGKAHPSHAAILLSLEGVFAAIGGYLWLGEVMTSWKMLGAGLMLFGMLVSQWDVIGKGEDEGKEPTEEVSC